MASAPARLNYNLYRDPETRSSDRGNGLSGTGVVTGELKVGPGVGHGPRTALLPLYGLLPRRQAVDTGAYSDTLVVTRDA